MPECLGYHYLSFNIVNTYYVQPASRCINCGDDRWPVQWSVVLAAAVTLAVVAVAVAVSGGVGGGSGVGWCWWLITGPLVVGQY